MSWATYFSSNSTVIVAIWLQFTIHCFRLRLLPPRSYGKPEAAAAVDRLLMMGIRMPEACWAVYKLAINLYLIAASSWLIHLNVWRCTDLQTLNLRKSSLLPLLPYSWHGTEFRHSDKFSSVFTNEVCVSNARLPFEQVKGQILSVSVRCQWKWLITGSDVSIIRQRVSVYRQHRPLKLSSSNSGLSWTQFVSYSALSCQICRGKSFWSAVINGKNSYRL